LKELPTPDLDQIKQEEQERGTGMVGFPRAGPGRRPGADTTTPHDWLMLAVLAQGLVAAGGHCGIRA
jgi:hypothetical protein